MTKRTRTTTPPPSATTTEVKDPVVQETIAAVVEEPAKVDAVEVTDTTSAAVEETSVPPPVNPEDAIGGEVASESVVNEDVLVETGGVTGLNTSIAQLEEATLHHAEDVADTVGAGQNPYGDWTPPEAPEALPVPDSTNVALSSFAQAFLGDVEDYIAAMAPNIPQSTQSVIFHQTKLFRTLVSFCNVLEDDFEAAWLELLAAVDASIDEDGAFAVTNVFRGWHDLPLPAEEISVFEGLLSLLSATAKTSNRARGLQRISMAKILHAPLSVAGGGRLEDFYNRFR